MGSDNGLEAARQEVEEALPELDEISDEELREKVVEVWAKGLYESDYESIDQEAWGGGYDEISDETQLFHVREVTQCAIALTDTLKETRDLDVDRDTVVAGALLHDISKFHETSPDAEEWTELGQMLDHPHYAVHMLAEAGLSTHLQHIALVHTHRSKPQPKTMEAELVVLADLAAADAIFWDNAEELLFDIQAESVQ